MGRESASSFREFTVKESLGASRIFLFHFLLLAIFFPEVLQVSSIGHRVVKLLFVQTILALASKETTLVEMSLCLSRHLASDALYKFVIGILSFLHLISPRALPY